MRLLVFADLHLGAPLPDWGEAAATRRETLRRALTGIVDAACNGADAVLVAGDLFDRPDPDADLVAFAQSEFARLSDAGIPVIVVPGNYDNAFHPDSVYRDDCFGEAVQIVREPGPAHYRLALDSETLHVHSFAWIPGATPDSPWKTFGEQTDTDGLRIGLVHASLDASPRDVVPGLRAETDTFKDSDLDLVILGRDHAPGEREPAQGPRLLVPGSPMGLGPDEPGERGYLLLTADVNGIRWERVPLNLPAVREETFRLRPDTSLPALTDRIAARISGAGFVRVILDGTVETPLDIDQLRAALPSDSPMEILDQTEPVSAESGDAFARLLLERLRDKLAASHSPEEREIARRALRHAHKALISVEADRAA